MGAIAMRLGHAAEIRYSYIVATAADLDKGGAVAR